VIIYFRNILPEVTNPEVLEGGCTVSRLNKSDTSQPKGELSSPLGFILKSMVVLSSNSIKILETRYLKRDSGNEICETPEQLFYRVAQTVAQAEYKYGGKKAADYWRGNFFSLFSKLLFLPNSPTLMNAGFEKGQLSACFVLPIKDNTKSIFATLKAAALIQKSGGGTGFNFSNIRPANSYVKYGGEVAAGPVGFMKIFDAATEQIKQGGKRRGANMAILNVDHPDIEAFIKAKNTETVLANFNLSVGITDDFMRAVINGERWKLRHGKNTSSDKTLKAKELWDLIAQNAWKTGDPGLIFLNALESKNPTPKAGRITATNPCGEMPLLDYESCNLGSINLSKMVTASSKGFEINWKLMDKTVNEAVRFLDDVIDVNYFPLSASKRLVLANRKIGLGVMGWAEMLIKLKIPYASEEAVKLGEKVMNRVNRQSKKSSQLLADARGTFPNWKQSIYYPNTPLRNATTTSIAPTGTISIIANTTSSIEPIYALAYSRHHVLDGEVLSEIDSHILEYLKDHHLDSSKLREHIIRKGNLSGIEEIPRDVKQLFLTASEIPFAYHLAHQAAFQRHTDNSVSKTINLHHDATVNEVSEIFMQAWRQGLKGITIYRDGSKSDQVLQHVLDDKEGIGVQQRNCRLCELS
jgi:ribonucleoside-diphosphate reductase alpha chain